uniref:INCENP_ARK-bind domain-containing protein n=1 Tax=Macrostomum lignano TaxID=282301 RepID=A0A1I8JQL8_9PLAT
MANFCGLDSARTAASSTGSVSANRRRGLRSRHADRTGAKADAVNLDGLQERVDLGELYSVPKDFWLNECKELEAYFGNQLHRDSRRPSARSCDFWRAAAEGG